MYSSFTALTQQTNNGTKTMATQKKIKHTEVVETTPEVVETTPEPEVVSFELTDTEKRAIIAARAASSHAALLPLAEEIRQGVLSIAKGSCTLGSLFKMLESARQEFFDSFGVSLDAVKTPREVRSRVTKDELAIAMTAMSALPDDFKSKDLGILLSKNRVRTTQYIIKAIKSGTIVKTSHADKRDCTYRVVK